MKKTLFLIYDYWLMTSLHVMNMINQRSRMTAIDHLHSQLD